MHAARLGIGTHVHSVFPQVASGGDLEGPGARHDCAVLDGVLHRPQAIPDGVLDLRQAVVRRTLRPPAMVLEQVRGKLARGKYQGILMFGVAYCRKDNAA